MSRASIFQFLSSHLSDTFLFSIIQKKISTQYFSSLRQICNDLSTLHNLHVAVELDWSVERFAVHVIKSQLFVDDEKLFNFYNKSIFSQLYIICNIILIFQPSTLFKCFNIIFFSFVQKHLRFIACA